MASVFPPMAIACSPITLAPSLAVLPPPIAIPCGLPAATLELEPITTEFPPAAAALEPKPTALSPLTEALGPKPTAVAGRFEGTSFDAIEMLALDIANAAKIVATTIFFFPLLFLANSDTTT